MPPSAMPPRAAGQPPRVDAATGWGSGVKVDQLTPWDTAGSAAPTAAGAPGPVIGHMGGHDAKSNEWSSSRDGTGRWSQPQQQPAAARPNYDNDINTWHGGSAGGTAHWGAAGHGGPPPPGNTGTWGAPAASGGAHHHDQHPVRFPFLLLSYPFIHVTLFRPVYSTIRIRRRPVRGSLRNQLVRSLRLFRRSVSIDGIVFRNEQ